jgi:pimeloyl-ACP methyl ester carboxylesterase
MTKPFYPNSAVAAFGKLATLVLVGALVAGCSTPVGVRRASPEEIYGNLTRSVLTGSTVSPSTQHFLYRLDLAESFRKHPEDTIAQLHGGLGGVDQGPRLFTLAELSFAHAEKSKDRRYYLASAAYAFACLLPDPPAKGPPPYDSRFRLAIDLYNRGLVSGLMSEDGETVDLSERSVELPSFTIDLTIDETTRAYEGYELGGLVAAGDFAVRGLRNRYRRAGVGAPLIAQITGSSDAERNKWIPPNSRVPVTAVVRFDAPRKSLGEQRIRGAISLYEDDATAYVDIQGDEGPLERETTAALAYRLNDSAIWDFEVAGFRRGDFGREEAKERQGMGMLQPYRPNRIPVVFIHGTASSPARWAEMSNELMAGDYIGPRYQYWYFMYNSGNPVYYSAKRLRDALRAVVEDVDPEGKDSALRRMVLVGHSQGGLLTKMMVISSGDRFYELIADKPIEDLGITKESAELLESIAYFEPLPFVDRVIFIATPHRGSFLADSWMGRLARRMVNLPGGLARATVEILQLDGKSAVEEVKRTSIDGMRPDNPFLVRLAETPIDERVKAHSIIAVKGDGPPAEGDDGVVEYTSAHIDGVESELIVRSGHSTQSEPATIEEVRRILLENVWEEGTPIAVGGIGGN